MQVRVNERIIRISSVGSHWRIFNSYLIQGREKNVLVDSAPTECTDCFIDELSQLIDIKDIDCFIFTHTDSARAGAADTLTHLNPNAEVIASVAGLRNIKEITNRPVNERPAKDSMVIELGGLSLEILITPNLSWPDTMMLYIRESNTLLSGTMFADGETVSRAEEYYLKELDLFRDFAKTAVERVRAINPDAIYPSEGGVPYKGIIEQYEELVSYERKGPVRTAAVIYAGTETGNTAELAHCVREVMEESGIRVKAISCSENLKQAVNVMNSADMLCFASPTIHRNAVPELMDVITRIDRVNKLRTPCMVIGSYGWGGEALGFVSSYLKLMKLRVFDKPFGVIMKPSEKELNELREFTNRFIKESEETI